MPAPLPPSELENFLNKINHGDDPYDERYLNGTHKFDKLPHCLHFHYISDIGTPLVRNYFYNNGNQPIQHSDVEGIVADIVKYAAPNDYVLPPYERPFGDLVWRRKCYVAFIVDSETLSFWPDAGLFFEYKNSSLKNHSFYDAKDITASVPQSGGGSKIRTGVFCLNHMKDDQGEDLGVGAKEYFAFSLVFKWGTMNEPLKYDPGGTNLGPPVSPP